MHARPAMKLFELVQSFDAEVMLRNESGTEAEASSVIALLMLDSAQAAHRSRGDRPRRSQRAGGGGRAVQLRV